MREGKAEWQNDTDSVKPVTLKASRASSSKNHVLKWVGTMVSKLQGTFVPRWKDIQDDPKLDLRGLLMQRKKRKEAPALESNDTP